MLSKWFDTQRARSLLRFKRPKQDDLLTVVLLAGKRPTKVFRFSKSSLYGAAALAASLTVWSLYTTASMMVHVNRSEQLQNELSRKHMELFGLQTKYESVFESTYPDYRDRLLHGAPQQVDSPLEPRLAEPTAKTAVSAPTLTTFSANLMASNASDLSALPPQEEVLQSALQISEVKLYRDAGRVLLKFALINQKGTQSIRGHLSAQARYRDHDGTVTTVPASAQKQAKGERFAVRHYRPSEFSFAPQLGPLDAPLEDIEVFARDLDGKLLSKHVEKVRVADVARSPSTTSSSAM